MSSAHQGFLERVQSFISWLHDRYTAMFRSHAGPLCRVSDLQGPRETLLGGGSLGLFRCQGCNLQGLREVLLVGEPWGLLNSLGCDLQGPKRCYWHESCGGC